MRAIGKAQRRFVALIALFGLVGIGSATAQAGPFVYV